jgi:predicted TPR repeat methyltransferase
VSASLGYTALLPPQADADVGRERILVRFDDGRAEELALHDYERLYAIAGLYEEIVQVQLGCRSPQVIASMIAAAAERLGWAPSDVRALDVGAGNGISGEALVAEGIQPVLATDVLAPARDAALRDRPGLYETYLVTDLIELGAEEARAIRALQCNALVCVAPVGQGPQHVPAEAIASAAGLLAPEALLAYMRDADEQPDALGTAAMGARIAGFTALEELERRRYVHRHTVNGEPILMDAVVSRVLRR